MKITVSNTYSSYNKATRERVEIEEVIGTVNIPYEISNQLVKLGKEYMYPVPKIVMLCLQYYFGDGKNHLACEHCQAPYVFCNEVDNVQSEGLWSFQKEWLEKWTQSQNWGETSQDGDHHTILDKGVVVVGLSTSDQGE